MLGWCMHCSTLRAIRRLPKRGLSNQIDYAPLEHAEPDRHRGCDGIVHEIDEPGVMHIVEALACELCEQVVTHMDVDRGAVHCPGVGKVIR